MRVVPLPALVTLPDRVDAVALTFDDGFANVMTEAVPLLEERGITATLFVVPAHVGGSNDWARRSSGIPALPLLGWADLGRLRDKGFDVGSHTRRHRRLSRCSGAELADEIEGAREDILVALGTRPVAFAYPYGDVDPRAAVVVERLHDFGCTTVLRPLGIDDVPTRLPRLDAHYFRGPALRQSWGTGRFRRWITRRRVLRAAAERLRWP